MQEVSRSYDQADENARQVVRWTRNVTRRKYTPEEKVRIVIEGIRGEISVSALCRREGINPGVYYKWLKDVCWGSIRNRDCILHPGVGTFVLIRPAQTFYERIKLHFDDGRSAGRLDRQDIGVTGSQLYFRAQDGEARGTS